MKLAEALQERADLIKIIEQLSDRLENNSIVQEGEEVAENPEGLLVELDSSIKRLEYLISRINITNSTIKVDNKTITELIAEKDSLHKKLSILRNLVNTASRVAYRASRTEIKINRTVDVHKLQTEVDEISKRLRVINNTLQQSNWTIDLVE